MGKTYEKLGFPAFDHVFRNCTGVRAVYPITFMKLIHLCSLDVKYFAVMEASTKSEGLTLSVKFDGKDEASMVSVKR